MIPTFLPLGLICLIWLVSGLMMVVAPSAWQGWVKQALIDPMKRFMLNIGVLFIGLLLMAGSSGLGDRWLWTAVGALSVIKALYLLGIVEPTRSPLFVRYERAAPVVHRLAGVILVALATLLAIDTIRGPQ